MSPVEPSEDEGVDARSSALDESGELDDRASGAFLRDFLQRHSVPLVDTDELIGNVHEAIDDDPGEAGSSEPVDVEDEKIAGERADPPGVLDG